MAKKNKGLTREEKRAAKIAKREAEKMDMREYVQYHLDLYGLGKMDRIKGPERGGRGKDQAWYQLTIIFRDDNNVSHFDDKYLEVYLGYKNKGGYWNRRNIRVAIEKRARELRNEQVVEKVWSRSQLAITSGRDSNGAIEL